MTNSNNKKQIRTSPGRYGQAQTNTNNPKQMVTNTDNSFGHWRYIIKIFETTTIHNKMIRGASRHVFCLETALCGSIPSPLYDYKSSFSALLFCLNWHCRYIIKAPKQTATLKKKVARATSKGFFRNLTIHK